MPAPNTMRHNSRAAVTCWSDVTHALCAQISEAHLPYSRCPVPWGASVVEGRAASAATPASEPRASAFLRQSASTSTVYATCSGTPSVGHSAVPARRNPPSRELRMQRSAPRVLRSCQRIVVFIIVSCGHRYLASRGCRVVDRADQGHGLAALAPVDGRRASFQQRGSDLR